MSLGVTFLGVDLLIVFGQFCAYNRIGCVDNRSTTGREGRKLTKWGNLAGSRKKKTGVLLLHSLKRDD